MSYTEALHRFVFFFAVAILTTNSLFAQSSETESDESKEKAVVKAIYEATKQVKSAKDYTGLVEDCDAALAGQLSEKHRLYVTSLRGWALNRRGNLRFETAEQLADVGNQQAKVALTEAMADYDSAIEADPKRWRSWMSRGIAHMSQDDFDLAIKDFSKVIELKPDEPKAWFNRAESNFQQKNFEAAIADYSKVLETTADDLEAMTGRGHAYYELSQFKKARRDYMLVSRALPRNSTAIVNLGDASQALGEWELAEEYYLKANKISPTPTTMQRFAWFKATCPDPAYRDAAKSVEMIEQAMLLGGESPQMLDTLAAAQAATGNFAVARTTQEKAIQLASAEENIDDSEFKIRLAMYEEGTPFQQDKTENSQSQKSKTENR